MRGIAVVLVALTALTAGACGGTDAPPDAACAPEVLYLNRTGAMYDHGARDDSTANLSLIVDGPRALPAWPHDDTDWASLVGCIRAALAPFPVEITEADPGAQQHTEIVFTTTYWAGSPGTTMVIPDSCQPGHEVEFVFGDALPTYARACHVALSGYAQLRGRLSLADDCSDILNDEVDCVMVRTFVDHEATCVDGFNQPTTCRCGGTTQNSFQTLRGVLRSCP